jgi:hypothetical protein
MATAITFFEVQDGVVWARARGRGEYAPLSHDRQEGRK